MTSYQNQLIPTDLIKLKTKDAMGIQRVLLQIILVSIATAQTLPGCQDTCGNVSIPYPFGTREGCYYNRSFFVACNETHYSPPVPFLHGGNIDIRNISIDGQIYISLFQATDCFNESGTKLTGIDGTFSLAGYTVSSTRNKFTVVGCDTSGRIQGTRDGEFYATGCESRCPSTKYIDDGDCSGIGCCQTSIPKRLTESRVTVNSFNNSKDVWAFSPCSYAFIVQEDLFKFSLNHLKDLRNVSRHPVVLDWTIGKEACDVAEMNQTSYACKSTNSRCENRDIGYNCNCSTGYRGNPYIPNGCQDINECEDQSLNECKEKCFNTEGSYECGCRKGYHGDGRKEGEGCSPDHDQLLLIKILASVGITAIVLVISFTWLFLGLKRRNLIRLKEKFFQQNGGLMLQQQLSGREGSSETTKIFTAEELEKATNNYNDNNIVGQGGYGTVYKGILEDNRRVAIKKSKIVDQNQIEQFINEVLVLSQINHRNVVKLLGCCLETQVPLLVYEFIRNGTLFDHIHNERKAPLVSWERRLRIAAETAGVLSYLHSAASIPIVHRDVKSTNVLLDDNFTAKVSDFGASRLVPLDKMQLSTMVQGTLGYLDPEYLHTSQLTEKSDVYSFGVVLLELLTGLKALSFDGPEKERCLVPYFLSALKEDRLVQVIDEHLYEEENNNQFKDFANLAKWCLRVKGEERPSMKEVAMELEGQLRMVEKHPWVQIDMNSEQTECLIGEKLDVFERHGDGSSTSIGFDTMRNDVMVPLDGGR